MRFLLSILSSATVAFGQGTVLWDESVNGPLSEDFNNPTSLSPPGLGTNSLLGISELVPSPPIWISHPNAFTFTVPAGQEISTIYLQVDSPKLWVWIGDPGFSTELAFIQTPVNGELLAQWSQSSLAAGTYGMYFENHDAQSIVTIANVHLDFFVQAVPEPTASSLLFVGAGFLGLRWLRKFLLTKN